MRRVDVLIDLVTRQLPWRITRLRDQHGLSMTKLAAKTGLARPTISQIERGVFKGLHFRTILSLAGFFEVGIDYMAGVDHAGLVPTMAILGHTCPECGRKAGNSPPECADAHSLPECVLEMFEHGRSHAFIAARHQLTLLMVEVILREEIRMRSVRAGRRVVR